MTSLTARDYNKASVFGLVLGAAPITRNQVIELTGLSKATVSRAVEDLKASGLVMDGPVEDVPGRGRPSTAIGLPPSTGHVVGASLGLKTARVLVTDLRGREYVKESYPTPAFPSTAEAAAWLGDQIERASSTADGPLRQVVVAVPARVRNGTDVSRPTAPMKMLEGSEFHALLSARFEAPVTIDSDANMAIIGVITDDALGSCVDAVLFSVSTALTFGAYDGTSLTVGRGEAYGDLGLLNVGTSGLMLDHVLSTWGLIQTASAHGVSLDGDEDTWPDALENHPELLDIVAKAVETAVTTVAVTLDPHVVYFSGRLASVVEMVLPEVRNRLGDAIGSTTRIVTTSRQEVGVSTMHGAVHIAQLQAREELLKSVLNARVEAAVS